MSDEGAKDKKYTQVKQEEKLEYVYFILIVGRMRLPMYWCHLGVWDGNRWKEIHSMFHANRPGYCNFRIDFQEMHSTGHHCISTCSAEELYEDRRFAYVFLPVFRQLFRTLKEKYGLRIFSLIATILHF